MCQTRRDGFDISPNMGVHLLVVLKPCVVLLKVYFYETSILSY